MPRPRYKPTRNGKFIFTLPKVSTTAIRLPIKERMMLLADHTISEREMSRRLGVNKTTAGKWRSWLAKLAGEKFRLARELVTNPLTASRFAREYYELGPDKMRLNHQMSNVATRGLILWLKLGGYIQESYYSKRAQK